MPKKIVATVVRSWGDFAVSGKYRTSDGKEQEEHQFETRSNTCRQTSVYNLGRKFKETLDVSILLPTDSGEPLRAKAFLLSAKGSPLSAGLKIKQYLPLHYRILREARYYAVPPEEMDIYLRPYMHQKIFHDRAQTGAGRKELQETLQAIFGLFNKMVHGSDWKPPKNMVRLAYEAVRPRYVLTWTGSNAFIVNRTLLHGLYGVLRDAVDFVGTGYSTEDMGLDAQEVLEALKGTNTRKLKEMARKMVDAMAAFRRGRANTPFSGRSLERMYFIIDMWAGIALHSHDITKLRRKEILVSFNPDHYNRPVKEVHTRTPGNFLPNWTTKNLAFRKWWERNAKFVPKFEKRFTTWLNEHQA
jgi:hypothetical protein